MQASCISGQIFAINDLCIKICFGKGGIKRRRFPLRKFCSLNFFLFVMLYSLLHMVYLTFAPKHMVRSKILLQNCIATLFFYNKKIEFS